MPRTRRSTSPVLLVLAAIVTVQLGSSFAKGLFAHTGPVQVTWLRLLGGALVLALVARPAIRGRSRADWGWVLAYGLSMALMNLAFYLAIQRIPIGMAVTIEFLGPLGVSVLSSRRARDFLWVALAGLGVALLGFTPGELDLVGVLFALVAAVCWGGYILLARPVGRAWPGVTGLTVALWVGVVSVGLLVVAAGQWPPAQPRLLAWGLGIGLLSSVIPYGLEMVALRSVEPRIFGILMSVEPAVAALFAFLLLGEALRPVELVAMACVVIASIGAVRTRRPPAPADSA